MNEIHRHNNETFHNCMWHYTRQPAGTCLVFIIKVVTTSPLLHPHHQHHRREKEKDHEFLDQQAVMFDE
jgi:hypothetical protein